MSALLWQFGRFLRSVLIAMIGVEMPTSGMGALGRKDILHTIPGMRQRNAKSETQYGMAVLEKPVRLKREVGLIGGISLIVGTIVGSGIFISPKGVLEMTGSVGLSLVVWTLAGLIALLGAICYSELGTVVQKSGGEYAYIMETLGPIPGFLFAWTSVIVVRTSSIAIVCMTFAEYMTELLPICGVAEVPTKLVAAASIVTLMLINGYSVKISNRVMIVFTIAKLVALSIIIVGGLVQLAKGETSQFQDSFKGSAKSPSVVALALYQALWAYDGWNNLNYVTEEIYKPDKNVPRANITAIILVTVVYLLTNISYLTAMTAAELLETPAVAVLWGDRVLKGASLILPIAVLLSTFGSANGTVFSGGRVVYAAGREGHLPEVLSYVHVRRLTPLPSIVFTCFIATAMIGVSNIGSLVDFFSFTAWLFYGTSISTLLIMRYTKRDVKRIIKVPIILPILFLLCAIYLVIAPIIEDPKIEFLYAALFIVSGLVVYIPFVHYKLLSADRLTVFLQLFFEVAPSLYEPDD